MISQHVSLLAARPTVADNRCMQGMGARLRARARELGLSDSEVARRLDLSQPRYANYVNDINEPDLATFARICRTLGTTPDAVLAFSDVPGEGDEERLKARIAAAAGCLNATRLRIGAALMDTLAALPEDG